jgi:uncharacterized protein
MPDEHPDSASPMQVVAELHRRQREMYAGGPVEPVAELLTEDIVWHVPGQSAIAGDHRGVSQVVDYFERRRDLVDATMQMHPGEAIWEGEAVAQFVTGTALLSGDRVSWKTIGVYRVAPPRIGEAWLVPLNLDLFDRIWSRSP